MACPGSLALEEQVPNKTSDYAEEGTAAHFLMEWAFKDNATFLDIYEGRKTPNGWKVTREMISAVQTFVDTVRATAAKYERLGAKVQILCENRVSFADEMGDAPKSGGFFGTADIIIVAEFKNGDVIISVDDYKHGMGVKVYAEDNEQVLSYGLAVAMPFTLAYNVKRVRMAIHQPRLNHMDEWEVPFSRILEFRDKLQPAAKLSLQLADQFKAGEISVKKLEKKGYLVSGEDQCKFCRAKAHCPVFVKDSIRKVDEMFDNLEDEPQVAPVIRRIDKGLVTVDQIEKFGRGLDQLEDFIRAVRGRLEAELHNGAKLKHFKLVQGRKGNRSWSDTAKAEKLFKKFRLKETEWYERTLISPTTAEKLFGNQKRRWKQLNAVIEQSQGRLTVAPIKDKREAVLPPNIDDMFDDLSDETHGLA